MNPAPGVPSFTHLHVLPACGVFFFSPSGLILLTLTARFVCQPMCPACTYPGWALAVLAKGACPADVWVVWRYYRRFSRVFSHAVGLGLLQ